MSPVSLTVERIGGASLRRFPELVSHVILRDPALVFRRVYVVSADQDITDRLLENTKTGKGGVHARLSQQTDYRSALRALGQHLLGINQALGRFGLDVAVADDFIGRRIEAVYGALDSVSHLLASGYVRRQELLSAAREALASIGDAHAAFNAAWLLRARGCPAQFVDLSGWGEAREPHLDDRIRDTLARYDPRTNVLLATGYCKGIEGVMREVDRDYADLVFAKMAVILGAEQAVLHGDHALRSGDPAVVGADSVRSVRHINFDVAEQLADIGRSVLHARATELLDRAGVALRINNAFSSEDDSTLVTKDYVCPEASIEVVAGTDEVSLLEVYDAGMVGEVGADHQLTEVLARHRVSYIGKSTNANTIDVIVWERDVRPELVAELRTLFASVELRPVALVCAIGSNIARPGVLARAAGVLAESGVNIVSIAQTARQTNIQFAVSREDLVTAQRALHAAGR